MYICAASLHNSLNMLHINLSPQMIRSNSGNFWPVSWRHALMTYGVQLITILSDIRNSLSKLQVSISLRSRVIGSTGRRTDIRILYIDVAVIITKFAFSQLLVGIGLCEWNLCIHTWMCIHIRMHTYVCITYITYTRMTRWLNS